MKKKHLFLIAFTILICVLFVFVLRFSMIDDRLYAVISIDGNEEEVEFWYRSDQTAANMFLPGFVDMSQVTLRAGQPGLYEVNGHPLDGDMSCEDFLVNERYPLVSSENADLHAPNIRFKQSEGVGALFLDVRSGDMNYVHQKKGNSETGVIRLYDADGHLNYSGEISELSGRGQSTWHNEKKSYNMVLSGEADLLGLGTAGRWVLQANSMDETNIRNKMIFDFAQMAGMPYTPQCQWVDLYLNGEYAGLYLLCERIEVHPQRVNISQNGSFLVTKDWEWRFEEQGDVYIMTDANVALNIRYADMSAAELEAIWQSAENAILAEDGIDPVTGKSYLELIDLESWANKILIEEIFGNTDGVSLSQYFYLDGSREDGRICAGPVWDYDLTMCKESNRFYVNKEGVYGSPWYHALFQKEEFMDCLRQQYVQVFRPLLQHLVNGGLADYAYPIAAASENNVYRWSLPSWQSTLDRMQVFLEERMEILDYIWMEQGPYVTVQVTTNALSTKVFILKPGDLLPELSRELNYAWYYEDRETPVDFSAPVYEDLELYQIYVEPEQTINAEEAIADVSAAEDTFEFSQPVQRWAPAAVLILMACLFAMIDAVRCGKNRIPKNKTVQKKV